MTAGVTLPKSSPGKNIIQWVSDYRPIPGTGLRPSSNMCHLPLNFSIQPTARAVGVGVGVKRKKGRETEEITYKKKFQIES